MYKYEYEKVKCELGRFVDGYYQSYWGYDSNKKICELIIPLINPDLFEL